MKAWNVGTHGLFSPGNWLSSAVLLSLCSGCLKTDGTSSADTTRDVDADPDGGGETPARAPSRPANVPGNDAGPHGIATVPSPTPATGSGDPGHPMCFGHAVACELLNDDACQSVIGCALEGSCEPGDTVKQCAGLAPRAGCESVPGCMWSAASSRCSGEVEPCGKLESESACAPFASCRWQSTGCEGNAVACGELSLTECVDQPGCTQEAPTPAGPDAMLEPSSKSEPRDAGVPSAPGAPDAIGDASASGPTNEASTSAPTTIGADAAPSPSGGFAEPRLAPADSAMCSNTEDLLVREESDLAGETYAFSSGDKVSTHCSHAEPGRVCLYGVNAEAGSDYANWGTGLYLNLSLNDEHGALLVPWDATIHDITGLRFRIDLAPESSALWLSFGLAPLGYDTVILDGARTAIKTSGVVRASFGAFEAPSWARDDAPTELDPANITRLVFQTIPKADMSQHYNFCVSDFEWLDSQGNVVDVEPLQSTPEAIP